MEEVIGKQRERWMDGLCFGWNARLRLGFRLKAPLALFLLTLTIRFPSCSITSHPQTNHGTTKSYQGQARCRQKCVSSLLTRMDLQQTAERKICRGHRKSKGSKEGSITGCPWPSFTKSAILGDVPPTEDLAPCAVSQIPAEECTACAAYG